MQKKMNTIQTKPIEESGLKLIEKLANKKKTENQRGDNQKGKSWKACYLPKANAYY